MVRTKVHCSIYVIGVLLPNIITYNITFKYMHHKNSKKKKSENKYYNNTMLIFYHKSTE